MLHAPGHPEQPGRVERHECDIEADQREPERRLAQSLMQAESECLRKPVGEAGKGAEQHPADDDVVKMGDQEQAVVQQEVRGRHGDQNTGQTADDEGDHEADRPQHRRRKTNAPAVHRE